MNVVFTVTGSTGTIGSELTRLLSAAQAPTRAVFRNAAKTQRLPDVVWLQADLRDAHVLEPTLAGTTRLFLLTDNAKGFSRLQIDVLRAAENLGVAHVVKLSALGASDHSGSSIAREHWEVEQALRQTSMTWTILRPHAFMQNWLGEFVDSVRSEGIMEAAIGDGCVPSSTLAISRPLLPRRSSIRRYTRARNTSSLEARLWDLPIWRRSSAT